MILQGARIFDGEALHDDLALEVGNGLIAGIHKQPGNREQPHAELSQDSAVSRQEVVELSGGILSPGLVDLQVNGGGGLMFNQSPSVATLKIIAGAHLCLGTTSFLPTLITDSADTRDRAIDAVEAAIDRGVPGIAGLHLEGPHISKAKKGAHDAHFIREMEPLDIERLLAAAERLPVLKITVATEAVSLDQINTLSSAGIIVSLGHSNASYQRCCEAFEAGARNVTHLFNAMSPLGSREPGLTGAALDVDGVTCGLIADGIHVDFACIRIAVRLKAQQRQLFLVSDAMAVAGTTETGFELQGRSIKREQGSLRLEDGTLAGADLNLADAVSNLQRYCGVDPADSLAMATSVPSTAAGLDAGVIQQGRPANLIWFNKQGVLERVWYAGLEQP